MASRSLRTAGLAAARIGAVALALAISAWYVVTAQRRANPAPQPTAAPVTPLPPRGGALPRSLLRPPDYVSQPYLSSSKSLVIREPSER